eukprot:Gb_14254 [translate_table: standard]
MLNLAYDVALVIEAMRLVALLPNILTISDRMIHKFTGLTYDAPEGLPKTPKLLAWTEIYGRGRILEEHVDIMRAQLQLVEDVEERRRKKGKFKIDENIPPGNSKHSPQLSTEHGATTGTHQIPIPPLPEYLTSRIRLDWLKTILDNFINLNYEYRWKILKKDCELFNHEQWRPTFTANVIDILVRVLVCKIKDPEHGEWSETKKAKDQAFATE